MALRKVFSGWTVPACRRVNKLTLIAAVCASLHASLPAWSLTSVAARVVAIHATQVETPIELEGLRRALAKRALKKEELIRRIKLRGVAFRLTKPAEERLRRAGGYLGRGGLDELVAAVRESYRSAEEQVRPPQGAMSAVEDFKLVNPNGVWSYGWTDPQPTSLGFIPYATSAEVIPGIFKWYAPKDAAGEPSVTINRKGVPYAYGGITHPPDLLSLRPGRGGERAVVRWTAPAAGTYHIEGVFVGISNPDVTKAPATPGTTSDVAITYNNGTRLFSAAVDKYGARAPFSLDVTASPGDTLDFSVGGGGEYGDDDTGLAVSIGKR